MTPQTALTETIIKALPVPEAGYKLTYFAGRTVDRYTVPVGFCVRVTAAGTRSFLLVYRDGTGEHRNTLGQFPKMRLVQAILAAGKMRLGLDAGAVVIPKRTPRVRRPSPEAAKVVTVADVLDDWTDRHGANLRTFQHYDGAFRRYVRPALGALPITELKKTPVRAMLDTIPGAIMRNKTVGYLSAVFNWYAGQVDDFVPPVLKGLKGKAVARDRLLTHDEIGRASCRERVSYHV